MLGRIRAIFEYDDEVLETETLATAIEGVITLFKNDNQLKIVEIIDQTASPEFAAEVAGTDSSERP